MNRYVVTHVHQYGTSVFMVEYDKLPTINQVVRCCMIDFEPEKGEFITVDYIPESDVIRLDWQDGDEDEDEDEE